MSDKKVKKAKTAKPKKSEEKVTKTLTGKTVKKVKAQTLDDLGSGAFDVSKLTDIKQLRGASYNPRSITESRLKDLGDSIATFGDLSGVVFNGNAKAGVLISGHQRIASIKGWKTKIDVKKSTDEHGTVGLGYIHAKDPKSSKKVSIPIRVVSWDNRKAEFAANIAANSHGGEFDNKKLATLVNKLDMDNLSPAILGLDPVQIRGLQQRIGQVKTMENKGSGQMNGASGAFREITEDEVSEGLTHTCPRCKFEF